MGYRNGYQGIRNELQIDAKRSNLKPGKAFLNFFMNKNASGREVLLLSKKYLEKLFSPVGTKAQIDQMMLEAETLGLILANDVFKFTYALSDSYSSLVHLLIDRHDKQINNTTKIKKELKRFEGAYKRNMAKQVKNNKPTLTRSTVIKRAPVSNSIKDMAKKLKIRLTKVVNGKRVRRTENELKNAIAKKKNNCNCKC